MSRYDSVRARGEANGAPVLDEFRVSFFVEEDPFGCLPVSGKAAPFEHVAYDCTEPGGAVFTSELEYGVGQSVWSMTGQVRASLDCFFHLF